jgi:pilus assembly protein CpaF
MKHFGKKHEEAHEQDKNQEAKASRSVEETGKIHQENKEVLEKKPANTDETAASNEDIFIDNPDTPTHLKDYLKGLNNPNAVKIMKSKWGSEDPKFLKRVEDYAETITEDLHNILDARVLAAKSEDEIKQEIEKFVDDVAKERELNLIPHEKEAIYHIIEDDIIGLGPLEELLEDDRIADIMVDGPNEIYIERDGQIEKTDITFRNHDHLANVCRRIVTRVGRHVDENNPICDARLPDGSRVNVIFPPLALEGPNLTIRKFKKDRLTLEKLIELGTIDEKTANLLQIIAACRVNVLISGGTGSGKTTLLNCLTKYISPVERIITCEDAAELQLQQPQVVRLETRPANIEGAGVVTMRDLVRNCLRMRPERIIVGEVRGPEAFDLMQAMNTGHDGSMGTLHANSPRDALFRLENMVAMANLSIPTSAIRQQVASSLEIIIHTQRLRDGTRKVMNITEVSGIEGDLITMQDLVSYEITGEDKNGKITGEFKFSHINPEFHDKAKHYNLQEDLLEIIK